MLHKATKHCTCTCTQQTLTSTSALHSALVMPLQVKEFDPLMELVLKMSEEVTTMPASLARSELEIAISDAAKALQNFHTNVLSRALQRDLDSHHVAAMHSNSSERMVSRITTTRVSTPELMQTGHGDVLVTGGSLDDMRLACAAQALYIRVLS